MRGGLSGEGEVGEGEVGGWEGRWGGGIESVVEVGEGRNKLGSWGRCRGGRRRGGVKRRRGILDC